VKLVLVSSRPRRDSTLRWTLSFVAPYRWRVAVLGLLSLAEIGLRALAPWPLKTIVDHLVGSGRPIAILGRVAASDRRTQLLLVVAIGLALQFGHELVLMLHTRRQARLAQRMVHDLRARVFSHLQYLSLSHHVKRTTADAVYRLDADAACLEQLLLRGVFPSLFSALTLVVMFAILLRLDAALAILSMVVVPFLYLSLKLTMRRMAPRAERAKELESAVVARLYESLACIRLVKTYAREDHELERFSEMATTAMRERMAVTRHESFFSFLVGAITISGASAVLALGGLHVLDGRLSVGTLLVIVAYLGFVYGPLSAIATTTASLQSALASAKRIREVLSTPHEAGDERHAIDAKRVRGEVRFEHVTFAYGPGRPVLDDVSLTARPGETIALVGLSGAGKTTLVSLLARLYDPASGRVLIDGVDVRRFRLRSLREQIGIVLQDSLLFAGTIADNIRYGRLDAADGEIELAARAAHADEFIARTEKGYDTRLTESGGGLSGGQKQRISIARAFLKDAPILILDEPTASLDTLAEQAVLAALTRLRKGRTTFVIAHRLSSVRDADRILVLDAGRIVAEGRHRELIESSDLYRQLCAQFVDEPASAAVRGHRT
jgi:ATP-binding cassette subfamily B protein/subfamily B ATP-binding cassette protein MsbA